MRDGSKFSTSVSTRIIVFLILAVPVAIKWYLFVAGF